MDEVKTYYNLITTGFQKLAPYYDLMTLPVRGVRKQVARLVNSNKPVKILDIATGTGGQAFAFAKRGFEVVGTDLSVSMLAIAKQHNKYPNLKFEVADATALPYPNGSFDVSSISFALHDMLLAIRQEALREMVRVTKPGGTILIVDYALPHNRLGRFLVYNFVRLYEAAYYREFIYSDLQGLLSQLGIEIDEEFSVLFGAGRILKGQIQVV